MRKLYILLILTFGSLVAALAQPTISIGDGTGCTGDQVCLPVTTENFTNINSLRFSVAYDPAVLSFTTAQNFNAVMASAPGNLGVSLFTEATPGLISFDTWETGDCSLPGNTGVTLPDAETLFELCFDAVGTYGEQTTVEIGNTPTSIRVTRNATLCNNIGLLTESGDVTLCVRELNIAATDVSGNEGDQVCVDFVVTGFDGLSGLQYSVNYDPAFLTFVSVIPNSDLVNNILGGVYGTPPDVATPGTITVSWTSVVGQPQPSLADGESMFTACFDINPGTCEQSTQITFGNVPTPAEASNEDPDNPSAVDAVPFSQTAGTISVNDCNPTGLQTIIDCGAPVEINDEFCVSFSSGDNFDAVRDMNYLVQWNPDILEFIEVTDPNNLAFFSPGVSTIETNVANGILEIDYNSLGGSQNMGDNEVIYNVCFRVIGLGGDSPIQIVAPGQATSGGSQVEINSTNCVVEVIQPPSVGLDFEDMSVPLGSTDCMPITVSNFTDVTSVEFSMAWDQNIWNFQGVQNINFLLNGATVTPIGAMPSTLTFVWDDAAGVTLPNDAVLFEVCFEAVGDPGECDEIITVGFPLAERATTLDSNGDDVGLVVNTATNCILFPEGFGMTAVSTTGGWQDTVCMNFTVESFDNILDADFFVHFDPTVLEFVSATPVDWTGLILDPPSPAGTVSGHFSNPTPVVLADGAVAFEVCFVLIGDPEECYGITIEDDPNEMVLTTVGEGSIVATDGEICVEDQIVIEDIIITPVSCPGACDGTVTIVVSEWAGQGFIGTTWHTEPNEQFTPLFLDNVCEGDLDFTVFDNGSGVSLRDTINIAVSGNVPVANILGDNPRVLSCDPSQIFVQAEELTDVNYTWYQNTILSTPYGMGEDVFPNEIGDYILEVTDIVSGCSSTDTVTVIQADFPVANAGLDPMPGITCNNTMITLNGSGTGDDLTFSWDVVGGTDPDYMDPATINTANLVVSGVGVYRLTVRDGITGCEHTDDVAVGDDSIFPNACLNPDTGGDLTLEQNCDGTPTDFDASCTSNPGLEVSYSWLGLDGGVVDVDLVGSFIDEGDYAFVVEEITTGCTDTVYAHLIPNSSAPIVTLDEVGAISCFVDSIMLNATVTPVNPDFEIEWVLSAGASLSPNGMQDGLTPTALTPGVYEILVTNPDNNCEANASITIEDQTTPPVAIISNDPATAVISCVTTEVLLDGTSSTQADTIAYQWHLDTYPNPIFTDGDADTLLVMTSSDYILEVINTITGCSALDTITVGEQTETPMVTLTTTEATIDCLTDEITVTATINNAPNFTFQGWTVMDGGNITSATADSLTVTVDAAGIYNIRVTSDLSGCPAEADFVVTENTTLPIATVDTDTLYLTCLEDFVLLNGFGSSDGAVVTYLWENTTGGLQPDMPTLLQTQATDAGTYRLTVTNGDNNCTKDTTVVVLTDTISPVGMIAEIPDLTCQNMTGEITVVVSDVDQYSVLWENMDGGAPTMPTTGETVTVSEPGTYVATILNQETACIGTAQVVVGGDVTPPTIDLGVLPAFDCSDLTQTIDASASGAVDDFMDIQWSTINGGTITPDNGSLVVAIDNIGDYTLAVVSAANGCPAELTFNIAPVAEPTLPTVTIAQPDFIGCDGEAVVIDASQTDVDNDIVSTSWDGPTHTDLSPFMISTTEVGMYTLTVVANGALACENSASVEVEEDPNTPVADAGMDITHGCGDVSMLDGTNSTPAPSATVTYEWITLPGSAVLEGDVTGPTPTVVGEGQYQLVVTDTENGCSDTSEIVTVTLQLPADADAGADIAACDDFADLNAVAVANTQGVWTTASAAIIDMDTDPATMVSGLAAGQNVFVWTLSAPNCPDYSVDSVVAIRATAISADDDELEIQEDESEGTVSLIVNDDLGGSSDFEITVLTPPAFGTYDTTAIKQGILELTLGQNEFGETQMVYQICSVECPDICATATVDITVLFDGDFFVPNTITPNNDGDNDELIFDVIEFTDADDIPDNELIIFNRWGDIIHQSKPYMNDWAGLNKEGKPVTEGTYYYVLRLNIGQGEIIKGDITIIR